MCISPATHVCNTHNVSISKESGEIIEGCGLNLCTPCEIKLREAFGGDSSAMAATLDQESKTREDYEDFYGKPRADVGFLCKEGILVMNLEKAAGDCADEDAGIDSNLPD